MCTILRAKTIAVFLKGDVRTSARREKKVNIIKIVEKKPRKLL